jgi:signal transduction histidine kinase
LRILQEALTNVLKHAQAKEILVRISALGKDLAHPHRGRRHRHDR